MAVVLFVLFALAAAAADARILRRVGIGTAGRKIFRILSIALWIVPLAGLAVTMTRLDIRSETLRLIGTCLALFILNGAARIVHEIFGAAGRRLHCERGFRTAAWCMIGMLCLVTAYGLTTGRSRLRTTAVTVVSDRLPAGLDGLRIALISDLHTGMLPCRDAMLRRLVGTVNALEPDMIAFCGDFVNSDCRELTPEVMEILSDLRADRGIYSVEGNHDLGIYIRDTAAIPPAESLQRVIEAQRSLGWTVLRDSSAIVPVRGDTITVTGLKYPEELIRNSHGRLTDRLPLDDIYGSLPESKFNITLSHAPQAAPQVASLGLGSLTLSGHVHSLQTKLPFGERGWSPAAWLYDQWSGLYGTDGGGYLYVNDGIGCAGIPMRIGAYPEVTLITLSSPWK